MSGCGTCLASALALRFGLAFELHPPLGPWDPLGSPWSQGTFCLELPMASWLPKLPWQMLIANVYANLAWQMPIANSQG